MTSARPAPGASVIGDLWGGLAAMLVALPSAVAFGVLIYTAVAPDDAGQGALAGILGAAALGITAPLVSRNGGFVTAPCAPAAAVMSALAAKLAAGGALTGGHIAVLLSITALLASVFQIAYGLLQAGRLIKFIPYQVVSGYLSGVGLVIALGQMPKLLGLPKGTGLFQGLITPALWNGYGIAVGIVTIAAMLLAPRLTQRVPAAILGLLGGVAAYFALALLDGDLLRIDGNPLVIGSIQTPSTFLAAFAGHVASFAAVQTSDISRVFVSALTLSVLLSIDTLKTGVVLDTLTRRRHDSNRELLGQGAANTVSSLVGGMPGSGTMGATLVNFTSGGRSLWSGVFEGLFVLLAFLVLGRLIAWVPIPALAGLLLVVAWRMFDHGMFRLLLQRLTRVDFLVIITVVIVAQIDLIAASVAGICLAILLFIRDQIRSSVIVSKVDLHGARSKRRRLVSEREVLDQHGDEAAVVQLRGNLFFGTADQLFTDLDEDLSKRRYLLLDLRRVQSMDFTAVHLFEQMRGRLLERKGELIFSGMPSSVPTRQDIADYMRQLGLASSQVGARVFATRDSAIEWMEGRILDAAGVAPEQDERALALGEIELFKRFDAATLLILGRAIRERSVPAGERVCSFGARGDEMFFVRRGRVGALLPLGAGQHHHLATFCQGDFFGEMAFLDREPRSADIVAFTPVDLYALSRERFDAVVEEEPALGGQVFEQLSRAVSSRLRDADAELRQLEER